MAYDTHYTVLRYAAGTQFVSAKTVNLNATGLLNVITYVIVNSRGRALPCSDIYYTVNRSGRAPLWSNIYDSVHNRGRALVSLNKRTSSTVSFRPGVRNHGPVFGLVWGGPGFRVKNGQNAYFYSVSPSAEHFWSLAEAFRVFRDLNRGGNAAVRPPNTGAVKFSTVLARVENLSGTPSNEN